MQEKGKAFKDLIEPSDTTGAGRDSGKDNIEGKATKATWKKYHVGQDWQNQRQIQQGEQVLPKNLPP